MFKGDLINTKAATQLLGISRPTFDRYRKEVDLKKFQIGKTLFFSKLEILEKLYSHIFPLSEKFEYHFAGQLNFELLKIDETSYDLRRISAIDGHATIVFICHLITRITEYNCYIHLLFNETNAVLKSLNFFGALRVHLNSKIFWNDTLLEKLNYFHMPQMIKLPITKLGYVGAQLQFVDNLTAQLARQGHSEEVCSYIGWAMGELSDNASTHAGAHPCFMQVTQFGDNQKFLLFTIGDVGKGIAQSLRENIAYTHLSEEKAILMAFRPYVSCRSDEEKRGKGLTDVLKIAMECSSVLWVESNAIGYTFQFNAGKDNFKKNESTSNFKGTIISLLFIDGNFNSYNRRDVTSYIDACMEVL